MFAECQINHLLNSQIETQDFKNVMVQYFSGLRSLSVVTP